MKQASLFDLLKATMETSTIGLAGVMPLIRAAMSRVAKEYEPGRKVLADEISKLATNEGVPLTRNGGKKATCEQLDKWLQPAATSHPPSIEAILCFCIVTRNISPLEPLLKPVCDICDLVLIPRSDLEYLEYGKTCDTIRKMQKRKRKQESKL